VTLHVDVAGKGSPLVLVHGWGFASSVWEETTAALAERFEVSRVDLPGFGRSAQTAAPSTLQDLAAELALAVPQPAAWLGWSLGGMACMRLAADWPGQVDRLIVVAASAHFTREAAWPGVDAAVLESFARDLERDYRATLLRFVSLQVRGSERALQVQRWLRRHLSVPGPVPVRALRAGLQILLEADLRPLLRRVQCPTLLVFGDRDPLVPAAAALAMRELLPGSTLELIRGAGHAPFLSHPQHFVHAVRCFLDV
jgi:pimeloyl-[acyl-carrier protein] methyl ester esterase